MHKRILVIAPRDCLNPFDYSLSPDEAARSIGFNSGNNIFWFSIQKLLLADGVEVRTMSMEQCESAIDAVNGDFDAAVMCPANALNYDFRDNLRRMARLFSAFRIPVIVIGLGAQSSYDYDMTFLDAIGSDVRAFVSSVLKTGGSIACRGHFTGEVLGKCGFRDGFDYEVLGCPSLYMFGPETRVNVPALSKSEINPVFNGPEMLGRGNLRRLLARFPRSIFVSQDRAYTFLYSPSGPDAETLSLMSASSISAFAELIAGDRLKLYCDFLPWRDMLRKSGANFAVGTRIHGCIACVLSGIPAYIWEKDSRVREMAEFFDIPGGRLPSRIAPVPNLNALYEESNYAKFNSALPERFARFKEFMNCHGLPWGEDFGYIESKLESGWRSMQCGLDRELQINNALRACHMPERLQRHRKNVFKNLAVKCASAFILSRQKRKQFRRRYSR